MHSRLIIQILQIFILFSLLVCKQPIVQITQDNGPFTQDDYEIMKLESEKVINLLLKTSKSEEVSPLSSQSPSQLTFLNIMKEEKSKSQEPHHDTLICKSCLWTLTKFHNLLEKKYGLTLFNFFLSLLCSIGLDYKICKAAIDLYSPTVIDALIEHYLNAEYICTKTYMCRNAHFIELEGEDYARKLLKDKPDNIFDYETKFIKNSNGKILKFLHVTDIHTDVLYKEVN
jgi:hypothetical protein